jgi:peptidoglycan/xylan/chitin deacetylase (PgdA/CDA1 family)
VRVPGRKLAQRSIRRLRSRMSDGIVVLGYHRLGADHASLGLAVARDRFAAHLEYISRYAAPMRLSDAVRAAAEGRRMRRSVVVTFDDGYSDVYQDALPLLARAQVPATVFVTSGYVGRVFWWDELAAALLSDLPAMLKPPELVVRGRVRSLEALASTDAGARRRAVRSLADIVCELTPTEREEVLAAIRSWSAGATHAAGGPRALTQAELRRLAASPYIDIGAHSVSHPMLTTLAVEGQRREVVQSRRDLEETIGKPVTSFSYPHGAHSAATRAVVADAGFAVACCSTADALRRGCDPLAVPRLWVGDLDGEAFGRWLDGWLAPNR